MAAHFVILAWRIPRTGKYVGTIVHMVTKSWTQLKRPSVHIIYYYSTNKIYKIMWKTNYELFL